MKNRISIGIDGPAGSGKSTVADMVAEKLSLYHLDTGAMYRTVGLAALLNDVNHKDKGTMTDLLDSISVDVTFDEQKKQHMFLNGEDVTAKIRTNEVSRAASDVATVKEVREKDKKRNRTGLCL